MTALSPIPRHLQLAAEQRVACALRAQRQQRRRRQKRVAQHQRHVDRQPAARPGRRRGGREGRAGAVRRRPRGALTGVRPTCEPSRAEQGVLQGPCPRAAAAARLSSLCSPASPELAFLPAVVPAACLPAHFSRRRIAAKHGKSPPPPPFAPAPLPPAPTRLPAMRSPSTRTGFSRQPYFSAFSSASRALVSTYQRETHVARRDAWHEAHALRWRLRAVLRMKQVCLSRAPWACMRHCAGGTQSCASIPLTKMIRARLYSPVCFSCHARSLDRRLWRRGEDTMGNAGGDMGGWGRGKARRGHVRTGYEAEPWLSALQRSKTALALRLGDQPAAGLSLGGQRCSAVFTRSPEAAGRVDGRGAEHGPALPAAAAWSAAGARA
jgi:hypothetical protein